MSSRDAIMQDTAETPSLLIDGLQYCDWSEDVFRELVETGMTAIHATVTYHGNFQMFVQDVIEWNRLFETYPQYIIKGRSAADILTAKASGKTAVFLGSQNPSPMEDNIGLFEVAHDMGLRVMQLTYNTQSAYGSGCFEPTDNGISLMGREAIAEMNRLGMLIDMSHSGPISTLQAIDLSQRPISITHANPLFWHDSARGKSNDILRALGQTGGVLGFSLYAHHLRNGADCTLSDFCEMVAKTAEIIGPENIGIGSDLCQNRPDSAVAWMRNGMWRKDRQPVAFPEQPAWFNRTSDFPGIADGLRNAGFSNTETNGIMGGNWMRFFKNTFQPAVSQG